MRGYDRNQVEDYVARTDAEIQALAAERDAALGRSADLAAQLANAHAQIEASRRQLAEATTAITPETVHARLRPLVENADAEARQIRQSADADAMRVRALGDADSQETRRQANEDAQRMRGQAQEDLQRATGCRQARARGGRDAGRGAGRRRRDRRQSACGRGQAAGRHPRRDRPPDTESTTTRQRHDAQAAGARHREREDSKSPCGCAGPRSGASMRSAGRRSSRSGAWRVMPIRAGEIVAEAHRELASLRDVRSRTQIRPA